MPASAVTGFQVDPGGYRPAVARLKSGLFAPSSYSASSFFGSTRPTNTDGLKVGADAIASTAPSRGSSATIAPPLAAHCSF